MLPGMPAMGGTLPAGSVGKTVPPFGRVGTLGNGRFGSFGSSPVIPGTVICGSFGKPTLGTLGSGTRVLTTNGVGTGSRGRSLMAASLIGAVSELPLDNSYR